MKFLFGFNAVPILLLALTATPAKAGCVIEQTASNEIVIKTSAGGCNTTALREGLTAAVAGSEGGQSASAPRQSAFSEIRRSSAQGALWRLANMNQAGPTSLTMPGLR